MRDKIRQILIDNGMNKTEALNESTKEILLLFGVSGSTSEPIIYCPKCKSNDIRQYTKTTDKCNNCNHAWYVYEPFKGV